MFERFTDRTRRVLVLAQEESRLLGHDRIGTEHLLLGLIGEGEGVAAQALGSLGISLVSAHEAVATRIGLGEEEPSRQARQFSIGAKNVLDRSVHEANRLGDSHIGTEHLLLGLLKEGEGPAVDVLESLGTSPGAVRGALDERLPRRRDPLVAVRGSDRRGGDGSQPDPTGLLTPADVETLWREHTASRAGKGGRLEVRRHVAEGMSYRVCTVVPGPLPEVTLAVAAGEVTTDAFDGFTAELGAALAKPVPGLGDRATFDEHAHALRVLSGSTLLVVSVKGAGGDADSLPFAVAVARTALSRMQP